MEFVLEFCILQLYNVATTCNTRWYCGSRTVENWPGTWALWRNWMWIKFIFACSRDWFTVLSLLKSLPAFQFQFCNFWSNKSCIVKNFELADKNGNKDSGFLIDGMYKSTNLGPQKSANPQKQVFCCMMNLEATKWNSGTLIVFELPYFLPEDVRGE